ncbi:MAG: hypothetical protein WEB00_15490 [Dehalococcoidia bacterium]
MNFIRRFGLVVCAAIIVAICAGFLVYLYSDETTSSRSLLDMDFAFSAQGSDGAELLWTAIAVALGAFALLSLLTALIPDFGRGRDEERVVFAPAEPGETVVAASSNGVTPAPVAAEERKLDPVALEGRMKEVSEDVDGVEHAETFLRTDGNQVKSSKVDLYLHEGADAGAISDEVASRVRALFVEFAVEPDEGFEVDIHQPRRFSGTASGQTA